MGAVKRTHRRAVLFQQHDKEMRNARRYMADTGLLANWTKYPEFRSDYMISRTKASQRQWWDNLKRKVMEGDEG